MRLKASSMHMDCLYRCWWKPIVLWDFSFFFSSLLAFALVLTISLSFPPSFHRCHLAAVFTVQCAGKQVFDIRPCVCVCVCKISSFWNMILTCLFPSIRLHICVPVYVRCIVVVFFHDTDWMHFYGMGREMCKLWAAVNSDYTRSSLFCS